MSWLEQLEMLGDLSNNPVDDNGFGTPVDGGTGQTYTQTCDCGIEVKRWLFLGMSIRSFSITLGWGRQPTTLTVELYQDTCVDDSIRYYLDRYLVKQSRQGKDPGLPEGNLIGVPVLFKYEDFEFAGIIQSWKNSNSKSGVNLYTFTITSPIEVLESVQLITNSYCGATVDIPNVINCFGFMEDPTVTVSSLPEDCQGYGLSGTDGEGMPWQIIKTAVHAISSYSDFCDQGARPTNFNLYLKDNKITFKEFIDYGYGFIYSDPISSPGTRDLNYYNLDLSEMPNMDFSYRVDATSISLIELIEKVLGDAGMDYYVELLPVKTVKDAGTRTNHIVSTIKVRVIDRSDNPSLDSIQTFVSNECANNCGVISYDFGQELTNDPTRVMVHGPARRQFALVDNSANPTGDMCVWSSGGGSGSENANQSLINQYWGLDAQGDVIPTNYNTNGEMSFVANAWPLARSNYFKIIQFPASYNESLSINERELQVALAGYDAWLSFIPIANTETWNLITGSQEVVEVLAHGIRHSHQLQSGIAAIQNSGTVEFSAKDIINTARNKKETLASYNLEQDLEKIFSFVSDLAQNFYGRQYLVKLSDICGAEITENMSINIAQCNINKKPQISTNYEIADSAWNMTGEYETGCQELSTMLDVDFTKGSDAGDFFRLDDYSIGPFVRWTNATGLDLEGLEEDEYGYHPDDSGNLYLKCNIYPDIVWGDSSNIGDYGRIEPKCPYAIVELPQAVTERMKDNLVRDMLSQVLIIEETMRQNKLGNPSLPTPSFQDAVTVAKQFANKVGGAKLSNLAYPRPIKPTHAAIPLKSNCHVWGPWYNVITGEGGVDLTVTGRIEIREDPTLTPWNFGSCSDMNEAGQKIANLYDNKRNIVEAGSVTMPGLPEGRIGAELLTLTGGGIITGQNFVSNATGGASRQFADCNQAYWSLGCSPDAERSGHYYKIDFYQDGERWTGANGPNITNINVNFAPGGITTTYNIRTYTDKFGFLEKRIVDQLKEIGRLRQEKNLELRQIRQGLRYG